MMKQGKGARAPSPIVSALAGNGPMREKFAVCLGVVFPLVVALRQESGQLGFDLPSPVTIHPRAQAFASPKWELT